MDSDPVNAREIARNNAIYATQNNRNPYIDHPNVCNKVWTNS
jgi:endonuclease I